MSLLRTAGTLILSCIILFDSNSSTLGQDAGNRIDGYWEGVLKVGTTELRLGIKVKKETEGLTGTLDVPLQNAKDLKLENLKLKDNKFSFEFKTGKASFEGTVNKDDTEIPGKWKQGGLELELIFKRKDKPTPLSRPQEPKKPYPYNEAEVVYANKQANVQLAGTLTIPKSAGLHPVVLLIAGSGPNNRNEALFGHKPFWVIADYLTRQGIAVLRVDKRGIGGSTGKYAEATSADFADDVRAGIDFLKSYEGIDPKKIGLIGHSEGGIVGPMVAATSKDVAFVIMLAGTGLSGEEILYLQGQAVLKAAGAEEKALARQRKTQEIMFKIVMSEKDNAAAEKKILLALDEEKARYTDEEKKEADKTQAARDGQIKRLLTPWFRYFLTYDPRPALMKVKCPVLSLIGEKDVQVPAKHNNPEIEKALKAGGNKDFTVKELPGMNHLFQTCDTGAISEYDKIEETVAPAVLKEVSDWILKHTR